MAFGEIETMDRGDGVQLAFERQAGAQPTFVWLGGFRSDMAGTKAQALAEWAHAKGQGFVRFDYSGHGRSGGAFEDQDIGVWLADTLTVLDQRTAGPLVLVGSSMGGWLALLAARERPDRVKALLLIAPAWDFTEKLLWPGLPEAARAAILETGRWEMASPYGGSTVFTARLIEAGRAHVIGDRIAFAGSVRILQGGQDPDVPEPHARALVEKFDGADVRYDLIAEGDHRLSRPQDIARLLAHAEDLSYA